MGGAWWLFCFIFIKFFFVIKKIVFMASDLVVYRISTLPSILIEMIFLDNFFPFFFTGYYSL